MMREQCWINSRISSNNYQYIIDRHIGKDSGKRDDNGVEVKDTQLFFPFLRFELNDHLN